MKCISARFDTHNKEDLQFFLQYLKLKDPENVFKIGTKYYPHSKILTKTSFLIEKLLGAFSRLRACLAGS